MAVTINGTTGIVTPDIGVDGSTLVIDAANNRVGVLEDSPNNTLTVGDTVQPSYAPTRAGNYIEIARTSGADAGLLINKDTGQWLVGVNNGDGANAPLRFEYAAAGSSHPGFGAGTLGMIIKHDGSVGIGTNDPQGKLHVSDGANGLEFNPNSNNAIVSYNRSTSAYAPNGLQGSTVQLRIGGVGTALHVHSDGNIGINQTSPSEKLEIYAGDILLSSNANGVSGGIGPDAALKFEYNGHQYAKIVGNGRDSSGYGDIDFYTSSSAGVTNLTQKMTIRADGRVGINRITPSFMLDIIGNSSTGANCIRITDGAETGHGSHPAKIVAGGTYYHEMQMHSRRFAVHTYDGSSIAERFRVHQTGQVLLGTQSPLNSLPGIQMYLGGGDPSLIGCKADNNPAAYVTLLKLAGYSQSSSTFRENAAILFETNTANSSSNASGRILFRTEGLNETNGPSTRVTITAEGKMGIGNEDPSGILDIKSTQTSSLKTFLRLGDSANGSSYFDFNMSDQSSGADEINHRKDGYVPKDSYGLKISSYSTLNGSYTSAGPASIRWYYPSAGGGNQAGGQLEFWTNQNGYASTSEAKRMQIDNYGNIGAPSGNNIYNASDERLKENMVNLTGCLEKIKNLRPISFTWKDGFGMMGGVAEYGFGAQTTQSVDEILVEPFGDDDIVLGEETIENPLRVNDKYIVPILVRALQEEIAKREALEQRLIDAGL